MADLTTGGGYYLRIRAKNSPSASVSMDAKAVPHLKQAVRELLEESLERIHANASSAATYLEQQGLRGSEETAAEQLLCARADVLVMCARREGCACGRGLKSGFVAAIHAHRGMSGLSTPVWKSTSVSGAPDNSSLSHFRR